MTSLLSDRAEEIRRGKGGSATWPDRHAIWSAATKRIGRSWNVMHIARGCCGAAGSEFTQRRPPARDCRKSRQHCDRLAIVNETGQAATSCFKTGIERKM